MAASPLESVLMGFLGEKGRQYKREDEKQAELDKLREKQLMELDTYGKKVEVDYGTFKEKEDYKRQQLAESNSKLSEAMSGIPADYEEVTGWDAPTLIRSGIDPTKVMENYRLSLAKKNEAKEPSFKSMVDKNTGEIVNLSPRDLAIDPNRYIEPKYSREFREAPSLEAGKEAFSKQQAKDFAAYSTKLEEEEAESFKILRSASTLRAASEKQLNTGKFSDYKQWVVGAFNSMGVPIAQEALANRELFQAESAKLVGQLISDLGAGTGISDKDLEFTKSRVPNILGTEGGNKKILEVLEANAKAKIEQGRKHKELLKDYPAFDSHLEFQNYYNKEMESFKEDTYREFQEMLGIDPTEADKGRPPEGNAPVADVNSYVANLTPEEVATIDALDEQLASAETPEEKAQIENQLRSLLAQ